jgi:hypothetical protein
MPAIRREAIDAHRRFCCPVPLTTPAPVHACRSCGRRQITDQEGRRRIPSARFCEFPAPHSPSPSILPLSRRQLYTDLTGLTATQLWQHPAWRAARRLDMSPARRAADPPACAAAAESRWLEWVRALAPVNEARRALPCRGVAIERKPCTVSPRCLHLDASRTKIHTGADRARCRRTASRSRHRSGCGCGRAPTTPRAGLEIGRRISSGVGRPPREPPIRVGPACRTATLQSRSRQYARAPRARCVGPHRLVVAAAWSRSTS